MHVFAAYTQPLGMCEQQMRTSVLAYLHTAGSVEPADVLRASAGIFRAVRDLTSPREATFRQNRNHPSLRDHVP